MKDYTKSVKILSISVTILYVMFLIWALYFKFGDINTVSANAIKYGQMTDLERFTFDIIPFDFSNTHEKDVHLLYNILNLFVFISPNLK